MMKFNLLGLFSKSDEDKNLKRSNGSAEIKVQIDNLVVGYLICKNHKWIFKYSDEFKKQNEYHKIVGFPSLNDEYSSDELWPFFRIRIPGLNQPKIKEIIESEHIEKTELDLLKRFGKKTISNPYELVF